MGQTFDHVKTLLQFPAALWKYKGFKLSVGQAQEIMREQMDQREDNFLRIVDQCIYNHAPSPYLRMLQMSGCQYGDVQRLVRDQGLEGALHELREQGVYVTYEEFKGRKPIVRNGTTIPASPQDFENPFVRRTFTVRTSGSTGAATNVGASFEAFAAVAPATLLTAFANGVARHPWALWHPILPGPGFGLLMMNAPYGVPADVWYSPIGWRDSKGWIKYGITTVYMTLCSNLLGLRIPFPRIVKLDQALVVAQRLSKMLKTKGNCVLITSVSAGLRVCLAAEQAGLDLTGVTTWLFGEPLTQTKAEPMRRVGARVMSSYGMVEASTVGHACGRPVSIDDLHLAKDSVALVTHPHLVEGLGVTVPSFNITGLQQRASRILLNFETDDYGIVEERHCGCELEAVGTTHLREIRSYSKLVGEGVTLVGNEMLRILEQVLPSRFGGSPLDYQLVEEEDDKGLTRLYLAISPRVEIADEAQVVEVLLNALRESSPMADAARTLWEQARTIQIKRQEPVWTNTAKLKPLHIRRGE
ncbi:MAG TPA: hypothetical protein VF478_02305 [Anaerolineae bacterium]